MKRLDTGWTMLAVCALYGLVCTVLERQVWSLLGAYRLVAAGPIVESMLAASAAVAAIACLAPTTSARLAARWNDSAAPRSMLYPLVAMALVLSAAVAYWVLERFQNSGDEFAYYFQAEVFAHGHLWAPRPPFGDTFIPYRTWVIGNKWLSQYPPGWPAILGAAIAVGIPAWGVNALLGAATIAVMSSLRWGVPRAALLTALALLVLTPFDWMNAASFYSHTLTALLIVSFCLCGLRYRQSAQTSSLVLGGILLGALGMTRYFSLILLLPAVAYWLFENRRNRPWRSAGYLVAGGLPFLALLMLYQYCTTGSPIRSSYSLINTDDVFVSLAPASVAQGLRLTGYRLGELSIWAAPLLLPVYVFCLGVKLRQRTFAFYDLVFPSFVAGYVFFDELGGNRYGPRYYFDAYPLMFMTILSAAPAASASIGRLLKRSGAPPAGSSAAWAAGSSAASSTAIPIALPTALISALYLVIALPFASTAFHRQVETRQDPFRIATQQIDGRAIVLVADSSGRGIEAEDLARNDWNLQAPILFGRPGVAADALSTGFPDRAIWEYTRSSPRAPGVLKMISARR